MIHGVALTTIKLGFVRQVSHEKFINKFYGTKLHDKHTPTAIKHSRHKLLVPFLLKLSYVMRY